jgi:hypothetical protein
LSGQWVIRFLLMGVVLSVCAWFARRNLRNNEADSRGARRLGTCVLIVHVTAWVFEIDHVAVWAVEFHLLMIELGYAVFSAVCLAVAYLAIEPFIRRSWPWRMIGWTRLLAGRGRDSLVGRDLLIGACAGLLLAALHMSTVLLPDGVGRDHAEPFLGYMSIMTGKLRFAIAQALGMATESLIMSLTWAAVFFFVTQLLRREWLAVVALLVVVTLTMLDKSATDSQPGPSWFIALSVFVWIAVFRQVGLLALCVGLTVASLVKAAPPLVAEAAWYRGNVFFLYALAAAFLLIGLHLSVRGRACEGELRPTAP